MWLDIVKQFGKALPNCYVIQPVSCLQCADDEKHYRVEDTIERHDGYFCKSCDEGWVNPALICDCCYKYVASRGITGYGDDYSSGNNENLKEGYDYHRWFMDVTTDVTGNAPAFADVDDCTIVCSLYS